MKPIDQVKMNIRQLISDARKQTQGKLNREDQNEFDLFFWNIRRNLDLSTEVVEEVTRKKDLAPIQP